MKHSQTDKWRKEGGGEKLIFFFGADCALFKSTGSLADSEGGEELFMSDPQNSPGDGSLLNAGIIHAPKHKHLFMLSAHRLTRSSEAAPTSLNKKTETWVLQQIFKSTSGRRTDYDLDCHQQKGANIKNPIKE